MLPPLPRYHGITPSEPEGASVLARSDRDTQRSTELSASSVTHQVRKCGVRKMNQPAMVARLDVHVRLTIKSFLDNHFHSIRRSNRRHGADFAILEKCRDFLFRGESDTPMKE